MVYGVENHGLPFQTSTASCARDAMNGMSCENFNTANLIHPQISTTSGGRKRSAIVTAGCNMDMTGLSREERRSMIDLTGTRSILKKLTNL